MKKKPKKAAETMAIPTTISLDDEENPKRTEQFKDALAKGGAAPRIVIREMVDAYCRFVAEYGRVPTFPLSIQSADLPPKKK